MLNQLLAFPKPAAELKFNINHPNALYNFSQQAHSLLASAKANHKNIVILCIGTDRSTGDSLGPLTGSKLKTLHMHPYIYGTLDDPVHATNLPDMLAHIADTVANPYVIAVDACLGKMENVGCLSLGHGSLKPGAAVNKNLPPVGDAYITGIVNVGGFMEHLVLQSTRLNLVVKMADLIAYGLAYGLNEI